MAAMGGDQRQMMEDAAEDKFPEGLRVLAVDGDCVCLKVLEVLLRRCKYNPTTVMDAKKALKMLRAGKEQFDLVITDVRMPDMDGFKLLELIRLEMDLPVIMLSVDCDKKAVMKGIIHGACDYFVKPVHTNELKNIWQHVESRRRSQAISHMSWDNDDDQRVQTGTVAKSKDSKNKGNNEYDSNENKESTHASSTHKNPRVTWKIELHNKFLEAINQIGLDKATPNKILELMNVDYLTRHNIASHLQKYRLYLNRIKANPLGDATERHSSSMNNRVNFMHDHGHERWHVSSGGNASWSPNYFSATGHLGQLAKTQSNLSMGSLIHGRRMSRYLVPQMPDARIFAGFDDPPISLYDDILNDTMLDEFSSHGSGTSYADSMHGKLMETSNGKIPSNLQSCLANTSSGGGRSAPANEYQVQPLQTINQYHTHMDAPSTQVVSTVRNSSKFPSFVGNYNNPRQSSMQVELTGNLHRGGTSLVPSHVDIPRINQLASYETSSNQLLLQNKISPFINNNTLVASFNEQVAPFNIPSNTCFVGMLNAHNSPPMAPSLMVNGGSNTTLLASFSEKIPSFKIASNTSSVGMIPNGNSAPGTGRTLMTETNMVNCGRTISALFDLQTDGLLTLTQILDGGDAAAILPMQEGIVNQQELNDQLNDINGFSSDDITNLLNDDFIGEDIVMDGE